MNANVNWRTIREEYEAGGVSLRQLATKHGVSKTYLIERRNTEGWNRPDRPPTDRPMTTQAVPSRDANAAQKATLAVKLRSTKMTYADVALQCGYADASVARKAIMRELDRCVVKDVEELRKEEMDSLERLELECWKRLADKDYTTGMLFAVDRILAIKDRRARLMGLDVKPDEQLAQQNYTKRIILTHQQTTMTTTIEGGQA